MARTNNQNVRLEIPELKRFLADMGVMEQNYKDAEKVFQRAAATTLMDTARSIASAKGRQQFKASDTLKVERGNTVRYGGTAWAMGAEFGSYVYKQFPAWTGRGKGAGLFFYPAVEEFKERDLMDIWDRTVWDKLKETFSD